MKSSRTRVSSLLVASSMLVTLQAVAGPYGDDMAKCLVKSSSPEDKSVFIKWLFSGIALHPDVASMTMITTQQREDFNKRAGALFQRLLTESCRTEAQQAIRYEGPATIQYAFQVFGQAAAGDLFANPSVAAGMKDLAKYIDQEKIKALSTAAATPSSSNR
jgi:hypothetical protein